MGGLRLIHRHRSHAREHGFALVGIEAGIGGDEFAIDADAGAPGMAFFAGILVDTDVHGLGFQLRAGFYPVCPTAAR